MRKVLFIGLQFDRKLEELYLSNSNHGLSAATNEFQWNLCDGFIDLIGDDFQILSSLPVGVFPKHYKKIRLRNRDWEYRNSKVTEIGSINAHVIKQWQRKRSCYSKIKAWIEDSPGEEHLLIVYTLYWPYLQAVSKVIKEYPELRTIIIVTDLPGKYGTPQTNRIISYFSSKIGDKAMTLAKQLHGYVLLTEEMKYPLHIGNKPYTIVEGITKSSYFKFDFCKNSSSPKYILYTGTLNKAFGIIHLLNAFTKIADKEIQLWICGVGNAEDEIKESAKKDGRIKYLGFQMKEDVLRMQANATILVNPRTTEGEYTKYSFPSKTIEYMASGVPVVMHKLSGIPEEYDEFLVYPRDDSDDALYEALNKVLSWGENKRSSFGEKAKDFILQNKNPDCQAKRILNMAEKLFKD